ncbi:MAG: hypothetical protein CHACPFDD_00646 [Phycisphaerae bacterium]|nr:hypothetical protein [Phycisphaerae bacterium]
MRALAEPLLAAVLAERLERHAARGQSIADALARVADENQRLAWAAVIDAQGQVVEFRKRVSLTYEEIRPQIDLSAGSMRLAALRVGAGFSPTMRLLSVPLAGGGSLAAIIDVEPPAPPEHLAALAIGVSVGGLLVVLVLLQRCVLRPLRRLGQRVADVRGELAELLPLGVVPTELHALVTGIDQTRRALRETREEAAELRYFMDDRVSRRTRTAQVAQKQAEQSADTDALSGLLNRRALHRELPALVAKQMAAGGPLSLMVIDVDHFKELNDQRGHTAGDDVIRFIGELIRAVTRRNVDLAVRYGGDEFVVAMPGAAGRDAAAAALRLATMFAQQVRTLGALPEPPALSIGVATLPQDGPRSGDDLLKLADQTMYTAKRNRRHVLTAGEARNLPQGDARHARARS